MVVVLGIDGFGWSYVLGFATVLLTAAFIGGVVYLVIGGRDGWWPSLLQTMAMALLLVGLIAGGPIAVLGGVLSFKNSYREVGNVDGHAIVVRQFAGWRGADDLDAGYRHGPVVSFNSRSNSKLRRTFTNISDWHFSVRTTASTVQVRYRSNDVPEQTGTLTLARTSPAAALDE